jgi:DNA-binding response OmpR family regulator
MALKDSAEKVLVVESDDALSDSIAQELKYAGYEVSTNYSEGMKSVQLRSLCRREEEGSL